MMGIHKKNYYANYYEFIIGHLGLIKNVFTPLYSSFFYTL